MNPQNLFTCTDGSLIEQAARGDRSALEVLLERHWRNAVVAAYTVLGNREEAFDVAQDTMLKVALELHSRWRGGSFRSWIILTARRLALNARTTSIARRRREVERAPSAISDDLSAEQREAIEALRAELAALPELTGQVVAMYHLHQQGISDIAEATGLSADACRQRLVRGRSELARRLERRGIRIASLLVFGWIASQSEALAAEAPDFAALRSGRQTAPPSDEFSAFARHAFAAAGVTLSFVAVLTFASVSLTGLSPLPAQQTAQASEKTQETTQMSLRSLLLAGALSSGLSLPLRAEETPSPTPPVVDHEGQHFVDYFWKKLPDAPVVLEVGAVAKALESVPPEDLAKLPGDDLKSKARHLIENASIKKTVRHEAAELPQIIDTEDAQFFAGIEASKIEAWDGQVPEPVEQKVTVTLKKDPETNEVSGADLSFPPDVLMFRAAKWEVKTQKIEDGEEQKPTIVEFKHQVIDAGKLQDLPSFVEIFKTVDSAKTDADPADPKPVFNWSSSDFTVDVKRLPPPDPMVLNSAPEKLDDERYVFRPDGEEAEKQKPAQQSAPSGESSSEF